MKRVWLAAAALCSVLGSGCAEALLCDSNLDERTLYVTCSDGPSYACAGIITLTLSDEASEEAALSFRTSCPRELSGLSQPKDSGGGGIGGGAPSGPTPRFSLNLDWSLLAQLLNGDLVELLHQRLDLGAIGRELLAILMVGPELILELGEVVRNDTQIRNLPPDGECKLHGNWWLMCHNARGERISELHGKTCEQHFESLGFELAVADAPRWCE